MQIHLANPRGFCAGVDRAITIVERALEMFEPPIYVRHEVVHNKFVVDGLRERGALFVDELHEVPDDSIVIFSAHGVSQAVRKEAENRGLKVFDATCPLVTKVHMEVTRASKTGTECILIGHAGHPEVEGTMGQYSNDEGGIYLVESEADVSTLEVKDPTNLYYCSQTTLSVDDTADDICYATQNRQDAVRDLAQDCQVLLVVGAQNSSNSNRLRELAEKIGAKAYLIADANCIQQEWLEGIEHIGVTAGASAPEVLVQGVVNKLKTWGAVSASERSGREENVEFAVPKELRVKQVV